MDLKPVYVNIMGGSMIKMPVRNNELLSFYQHRQRNVSVKLKYVCMGVPGYDNDCMKVLLM